MINKAKMVAYLEEHFPECVEEFVEECTLDDDVALASYCEYLDEAFCWCSIPSGSGYWGDISDKLLTEDKDEERVSQEATLASPPLAVSDRRDTLLRVAYELLKECEEGPYVKDVMSTIAVWDEEECDGYCLMEEIGDLLGIDSDED